MNVKFLVDEDVENSQSYKMIFNNSEIGAIFCINNNNMYDIELYIYEGYENFCVSNFNIDVYYTIIKMFIENENIEINFKANYDVFFGTVGEIEKGLIIIENNGITFVSISD